MKKAIFADESNVSLTYDDINNKVTPVDQTGLATVCEAMGARAAGGETLHLLRYRGMSFRTIQHFESLTSTSRVRAFIVDDSVLKRNRCKKAELLARVHDHTSGRFVRGYTMLTLGWSDGFSFAPIDFVMLSSAKLANRFCEIKERLSKRTQGYK